MGFNSSALLAQLHHFPPHPSPPALEMPALDLFPGRLIGFALFGMETTSPICASLQHHTELAWVCLGTMLIRQGEGMVQIPGTDEGEEERRGQ